MRRVAALDAGAVEQNGDGVAVGKDLWCESGRGGGGGEVGGVDCCEAVGEVGDEGCGRCIRGISLLGMRKLGGEFGGCWCVSYLDEDDICSGLSECHCHGLPDAASASCDEGGVSFEREKVLD